MKTNKEERICNTCVDRVSCLSLCYSMQEKLKNLRKKNGCYSENTHATNSLHFDSQILDAIMYNFGMSEVEERDSKRIIFAILTIEQKSILALIGRDYNQKEIAKILHISQAGVSQKLKTIKKMLTKHGAVILQKYVI